MLQVRKQNAGNILRVWLIGSIEERVDFAKLIGPPPQQLEVNLKGVTRINSAGVKAWITYFQECKTKGIVVSLFECSPAIIEQLNLISNFLCGAKIISLYTAFFCRKCDEQRLKLFIMQDLRAQNFKLSPMNCEVCGTQLDFDGQEEDYFQNVK